jgi:hypothetical protein
MQTLNTDFKGAAVGPFSEVIYANQINHKNFTFRVLPEIIFAFQIAMYLPKNHFLVDEIEKCIGLLHSAGLINYWEKLYVNSFYMNYKVGDDGPKILTFGHLSGIFYILMGGCGLSFICFLFELFHKRALIVARNLRLRKLKKRRVHFEKHFFIHELPRRRYV